MNYIHKNKHKLPEGKQLAASRDTKFIETSSGIQHNVDELLVGVLKQVCTSFVLNCHDGTPKCNQF